MSLKVSSLVEILRKIDGGEEVTVHSIMNDLELSERTVHRYLDELRTAGYPIFYDRSKESYRFSDGYCLKKPNLSLEESLALALAKKLVGNYGSGFEASLSRIEGKISSKKTDLPNHVILSVKKLSAEIEQHLNAIQHAINNYKRIKIKYKNLYSDEETVREVDPYYLFFESDFWNMRGFCHLREEFRTFALDRIISLKVMNKHFLPKRISPDDELSGSFGGVIDGEPVEVVIRFDAGIKAHVLRKKWHESQTNRELKDGRLETAFIVNGFEGIKGWIYQWMPCAEVASPEELRKEIESDMKTAYERHHACALSE